MKAITKRFQYFFLSTKGLALVAIALLSLVTAIWGTLSGPLAEMGINDVTVRLLGMDLVPAEREGRLIMLYHSIAMTVVAILVYYITGVVQMKKHERVMINATVTLGYMLALSFGMLFAYFGHNWIYHGLFIAGQTLMYFGGILLAAALWPWKKEYYIQDGRRNTTSKTRSQSTPTLKAEWTWSGQLSSQWLSRLWAQPYWVRSLVRPSATAS